MQISENAKKVANILAEKKAQDILIIHVSDKTIISDYFVIASGTSTTHTSTLAEEVELQMAKENIRPLRHEGIREGRWAVIDYGDVLVHIFHNDERDFYQLERLWTDGDNYIKYED